MRVLSGTLPFRKPSTFTSSLIFSRAFFRKDSKYSREIDPVISTRDFSSLVIVGLLWLCVIFDEVFVMENSVHIMYKNGKFKRRPVKTRRRQLTFSFPSKDYLSLSP